VENNEPGSIYRTKKFGVYGEDEEEGAEAAISYNSMQAANSACNAGKYRSSGIEWI